MSKRTTALIIVLIVLAAGLGAMYYQNMAREYYYGQVGRLANTDESKGNHDPDVYWYNIKGYNKQGKFRELHVGSYQGHKFTKGHYIKVGWSQHKGVISYEEVSRDQVPKQALSKINND